MNIEDLVLIEVFGEGHYSGQTRTCAVVVEKSFIEDYSDEFCSVCFHELDGWGSEVEGVVNLVDVTKDNLQNIISTLLNVDGDDYIIWEQLMDGVDSKVVEEQIIFNTNFHSRIERTTVTKYYLDGEEV